MTMRSLQGMLTIEVFLDENSKPQLQFDQNSTQGLNKLLTAQLGAILPKLPESSYCMVGGLYQSSELLKPFFPIHTQLRQYANAALKGENNRRNQLIIGANEKGLPEGLKLNKNVQLTPLLLLPFVIITDDEQTKTQFEQQLMHKGMGSVELLKKVQDIVGIKVRHVNLMTVLDLAAMMHNHLQMAGFEPLWDILEQALFNANPETKAITPQFNEFYLSKKIVFSPFFSHAFWCNQGPGKDLKNKNQAYLHYTQVQRQYIATLAEHGLDVRQFAASTQSYPIDKDHVCFATLDSVRLTGDFYHEIIKPLNPQLSTKVDKHAHEHLGVLYYQISDSDNGLEFYYPLTVNGVKSIENILEN